MNSNDLILANSPLFGRAVLCAKKISPKLIRATEKAYFSSSHLARPFPIFLFISFVISFAIFVVFFGGSFESHPRHLVCGQIFLRRNFVLFRRSFVAFEWLNFAQKVKKVDHKSCLRSSASFKWKVMTIENIYGREENARNSSSPTLHCNST